MKATAFAAPVLVLALIHLLHRIEVWARSDTRPASQRPPTRPLLKGQPMPVASSRSPQAEALPLPHDPPPPPGWADPLAGTGVEETVTTTPADEEKVSGRKAR